MKDRIRRLLKDNRAASFPTTIGIVLALLILLCGVSEYFRLQIIAAGVRDAVEDAIISTVNDNYAGVYHGVRKVMQEHISLLEKEAGKKHWIQVIFMGIWTKHLEQFCPAAGT